MEDFKQRRDRFDNYLEKYSIKLSGRGTIKYTCPCCGFPTLNERGGYQICILCEWEDDGQDDIDADEILGGPNGFLNLTDARNNFQKYGRCDMERSYDDSYKEVRNKLIVLFYQLLSVDNSNEDIAENINNCYNKFFAILSERVRAYEERILTERENT